jgi:hypothetical protein
LQFVGGGVQIDVIEAGAVEAEDRALRRAVGGAERGYRLCQGAWLREIHPGVLLQSLELVRVPSVRR